MQISRSAVPAALIAAALIAGTAACSGSSSQSAASASAAGTAAATSASPTADPLASTSANQVVTTALNNLKSATGVHISGTLSSSGQTISLDLALAQDKGCSGSMSLKGKGSFELIYLNKNLWMKPDDQFYKNVGAGSALSLLSGKWLKPSSNSGMSDFATFCTVSGLAGSFSNSVPGGVTKAVGTPINGQPTVEIKDTAHSAAMYVSDTATPEVLRITASGSGGGQLDFSGYGAPATISAPPADQTINGAQYGF
jgi:hypothetical protein